VSKKRVLTIKSDYCKDWTIKEALREIIQNSLDTKTPVHFEPQGDNWIIRDEGAGIILSDFLIGQTSKATDSTVIGQFGEGLKLACLVLARENRKISIASKDKRYAFVFEYNEQWEAKLLTIFVDDIEPITGTVVTVECTDEQLDDAKHLFRLLTPKVKEIAGKDGIILEDAGKIFVNGLLVTELEGIFGYDFVGQKELVNRDRNAINDNKIKESIAKVWSGIKDVDIIRKFLDCAVHPDFRSCIEMSVDFSLSDTAAAWKSAVESKWGTRVCLSSDNIKANRLAEEANWKVISELSWLTRYNLHYYKIMKRANEVIENKDKRIVSVNELSSEQKGLLEQGKQLALRIAQYATLRTFPVHVYVDEQAGLGTKQYNEQGYFDPKTETIGVEISTLDDTASVARTILHEFVHGTFKHEDATREFESDCLSIISKLGIRILESEVGK